MKPERMAGREALDVALEAAVTVMNNGGPTRLVEKTFRGIARGCGRQKKVSTTWRLDFASARDESAVVMRPVGPIRDNLLRVSEGAAHAERVRRGEVEPGAIRSEIERIRSMPAPYSRIQTVLALTAATVGFVRLANGGWGSAACASIAAVAGFLLRGLLARRHVPAAPSILVCGILSSCLAALALRFGFADARAATVVASVLYLLPGLTLVTGFVDVLSERYLVLGLERIANAALQSVILAIAVQFGVVIAS